MNVAVAALAYKPDDDPMRWQIHALALDVECEDEALGFGYRYLQENHPREAGWVHVAVIDPDVLDTRREQKE